MARSHAELRECLDAAHEALSRYKLRTTLSVLGIVLGIAAVVAMLSVGEAGRREALQDIQSLGLDNLIIRSRVPGGSGAVGERITAADADRLHSVLPLSRMHSPLIERHLRISRGTKDATAQVLGVRAEFQVILRLSVKSGRLLSTLDEGAGRAVCVLGGSLSRKLFGPHSAIGERLVLSARVFKVIGVLGAPPGTGPGSRSFAWRDMEHVVLVPLPVLSGRTLEILPNQPVDEIWIRLADGNQVSEVAQVARHSIDRLRGGRRSVDVIVPEELLAQRYRTQRTFNIVVGSVAVLALIVGGIGIMNVMLTSVIERTREIGLRRTVGATRRSIALQFLIEALIITMTGGVVGIALGVMTSWMITAYAGWNASASLSAVALAFIVSCTVGLMFGWYPAIAAAHLQPVDAVRYE